MAGQEEEVDDGHRSIQSVNLRFRAKETRMGLFLSSPYEIGKAYSLWSMGGYANFPARIRRVDSVLKGEIGVPGRDWILEKLCDAWSIRHMSGKDIWVCSE